MTASNDSRLYKLLTEEDRSIVRGTIPSDDGYFYHVTLSRHLESLKQYGLDPRFESDESSYAHRRREPAKAMRYCTMAHLNVGLSAGDTRNQEWNPALEIHVPGRAPLVILRVAAETLLGRSFGLDHSYSPLAYAAEEKLRDKSTLTAEEFAELTKRYGAISCYEVIAPQELEICVDVPRFRESRQGAFAPLLSQSPVQGAA